MHSLSLPEILVILALGMLLFGNRLPSVGKSLGEGIRNFKKGLNEKDTDTVHTPEAPASVAQPTSSQIQHPQPVLAQNVLPTSLEGQAYHMGHSAPLSRSAKEAVVDVEHGDEHK